MARFTIPQINDYLLMAEPGHNAILGLFRRAESAVLWVPGHLSHLENQALPDLVHQYERTDAAIGAPFTQTDELREARQKVNQLRHTLECRYANEEPAAERAPETDGYIAADHQATRGRSSLYSTSGGRCCRSEQRVPCTWSWPGWLKRLGLVPLT